MHAAEKGVGLRPLLRFWGCIIQTQFVANHSPPEMFSGTEIPYLRCALYLAVSQTHQSVGPPLIPMLECIRAAAEEGQRPGIPAFSWSGSKNRDGFFVILCDFDFLWFSVVFVIFCGFLWRQNLLCFFPKRSHTGPPALELVSDKKSPVFLETFSWFSWFSVIYRDFGQTSKSIKPQHGCERENVRPPWKYFRAC